LNELDALVKANIITNDEMKSIISIVFNPVRVGFHSIPLDSLGKQQQDGFELKTTDILNVGVNPKQLLSIVKDKYLSIGGEILENTALSRIDVFLDRSLVTCSSNNLDIQLSSRLVIDAMGNTSPIVQQIRGPVEPDGICIVVGSCARGFNPKENTYGDVIYTNSPITQKQSSQMQYFWEAFPTGSGDGDRTTYLFSYLDAKKERPSVAEVIT